jgi:hypothetical protein
MAVRPVVLLVAEVGFAGRIENLKFVILGKMNVAVSSGS